MTSHSLTRVAAPTWGRSAHAARANVPRNTRRPSPIALRAAPLRPLELRVQAPRLGGALVGGALAAGFALMWVFLLLGVVGPAAGIR